MSAGRRKRNHGKFPVGAFMALQKEKREASLKISEAIRHEDMKIQEKERELRAKREKLRRLDMKINKLVEEIERESAIQAELDQNSVVQPVKKKRRFLSEKSIKERQKNPTLCDESSVSQATFRRRRAELFQAACDIHGANDNWTVPGQVGLCDTTVRKCPENILVEVFSKADKITKRVFPRIYKKTLVEFEKAESNVIRSIALYYSGGIMGKRKYRAACRDISYNKHMHNSKSTRLEVNNCSIPKLVPYNKLMAYIKSINIGKLHNVSDTLCEGLSENEKVTGVYRDIKELLVCLARYYLMNEDKYKLVWFDENPYTFHVAVGGDGAPFGKEDTACCWLVSFLNICRGVLSSSENFLLFGANCKEDCAPMIRFLEKLLSDIEELEKSTYSISFNGKSVDVKFIVSELPNDMKMLSFLGGELSNAATYFSTFANVSLNDMGTLGGSFGFSGKQMWKPWDYQNRLSVAEKVEKFKSSLRNKKLSLPTVRSKVTSFISQNKSRQEFKPLVGRLIDKAHVDPLHAKNNACAHTHRQLLNHIIAMSNLGNSAKVFSLVPTDSAFKIYVNALHNCNLTRLAKKIVKWFDDTHASGKAFDYRFTGKDSRLFLLNFMSLISAVEPSAPSARAKTFLHILFYICLCLRNCVSLFSRLEISSDEISQLSQHCCNYFRANALFFSVNPTIWTIGFVVPVHTQHMKKTYGLGLGLNSMEGREAKHVFVSKYSRNTNYQQRWEQIFLHEFVSLLWLRERGYNLNKANVPTPQSYIPNFDSTVDQVYCSCGLRIKQVSGRKCRFCDGKLRSCIELSVIKGKVLVELGDLK